MQRPNAHDLDVFAIEGDTAILPFADWVRETVVELPRHVADDDARIGWKPLEHAGRAGNLGGCRHEVNSCASGLHFKSRHELNVTPYNRVSTDIRASGAGGQEAEARLDELLNPAVGKPAPEIDGVDFHGMPLKLSDYQGKVVVVVFWGSWCGPCMALVPHAARAR